MKVLFTKGDRGRVEYDIVRDEAPEPPGTHAVPFDDFTTDEMPATWAGRRVWDDATGGPRMPSADEDLRAAKDQQAAAVRDAATADANRSASPVEHRAVGKRWARPNVQLTPREQHIHDTDEARYVRLTGLLEQIEAAATIEAVEGVVW